MAHSTKAVKLACGLNFDLIDKFCVYRILNTVNNKSYIGCTAKPLIKRVKEHFRRLFYQKHHNCELQSDYNEFGEDVFQIYCLDKSATTTLDLEILEGLYSNKYSSTIQEMGYNLITPGEIKKQSQRTKVKISTLAKERHKNNPDVCLNNLKKIDKECQIRAGISRSKWLANNTNPASKPVIAYNKYSGKQYFFWCVRDAAKFLYINASTINRRLIKTAPSEYKGERLPYHFAYYNG